MNWFWFGGLIFMLGTLIAAWPEQEAEAVRVRVPSKPIVPKRSRT
jgi:cytochrome c-type biogenesis protein CcmF